VSSIDRNTAKLIGAACEEALREVAEKYGLTVTVRGGSYDPNVGTFTPKIVFAEADAAKNEFDMYAHLYMLNADDFGKEFVSRGHTYRVSGIKTRATKMPILATEVGTDKVYKFASEIVVKALHPETAVA
jgi:hypothetical protein